MPDSIDSVSRLRGTGVTDTSRSPASRPGDEAPAPAAPAEGSVVELRSADALRELEQIVASLPDVDRAKIEAIKQAISQGAYEVDADVVAQKFMEVEELLAGL